MRIAKLKKTNDMKGTEQFKQVIKDYLDRRAAEDAMFAERYANPKKSIDKCVSYIIGTVKASGRCGFADDEIYGMAVHYYDEADIKVKQVDCGYDVVVNQSIPLTDEEKKEAHERALRRYEEDELNRIKAERNTADAKKRSEKKAGIDKHKQVKPSVSKKNAKPANTADATPSGLLKQLELF